MVPVPVPVPVPDLPIDKQIEWLNRRSQQLLQHMDAIVYEVEENGPDMEELAAYTKAHREYQDQLQRVTQLALSLNEVRRVTFQVSNLNIQT